MSNIKEYLKNKENDKRALYKEEILDRLLKEKSLDTTIEDIPIEVYSLIDLKEKIENDIQLDYCWERTSTGFKYRNNFKLNESGNDILFDSYSITMSNDKFESDGSEVSDNFLKANVSELESLLKINIICNMLAPIIESDIKRHLSYWKNYFLDSRVKMNVDSHSEHTDKYFTIYGDLGKELLVKWLNNLSDNKRNLNDLLEEFIYDITAANIYFKNTLNVRFLRFAKFEYVLLDELKKYSPRGKEFRSLYIEMTNKLTRFDEMKKTREI